MRMGSLSRGRVLWWDIQGDELLRPPNVTSAWCCSFGRTVPYSILRPLFTAICDGTEY